MGRGWQENPRGLRVLVADASPAFREAIGGWLSAHPRVAEVGASADGEAALARVRHGGVDLVLVDAVLPPDGGFALARRLRDLPDPPLVVLLVLYDYDAVRREAVDCGAVAALDKSALLPRLGSLLEGLTAPPGRPGSRNGPGPPRPGFPGAP